MAESVEWPTALPCPFCGDVDDLHSEIQSTEEGSDSVVRSWYAIACMWCSCRGPSKYDPDGHEGAIGAAAAVAWNDREDGDAAAANLIKRPQEDRTMSQDSNTRPRKLISIEEAEREPATVEVRYKITVQRTAVEMTLKPREWQPGGTIDAREEVGGTYGYAPEILTRDVVERQIYSQVVDEFDLAAVIAVINRPRES